MDNLVITFSIGKSGSTTVMQAIKSAGMDAHRAYPANLLSLPYKELPIVFLIRDPIARRISQTFEHAKEIQRPLIYNPGQMSLLGMQAWADIGSLVVWMQHLGLPVGSWRFNKKQGMAIKKSEFGNRVLFIRTDYLWRLHIGLADLLDCSPLCFNVEHRAKGVERFEGYQEFIDSAKFPLGTLERIYTSDFCKHFWYAKELKQLVEKWRE